MELYEMKSKLVKLYGKHVIQGKTNQQIQAMYYECESSGRFKKGYKKRYQKKKDKEPKGYHQLDMFEYLREKEKANDAK